MRFSDKAIEMWNGKELSRSPLHRGSAFNAIGIDEQVYDSTFQSPLHRGRVTHGAGYRFRVSGSRPLVLRSSLVPSPCRSRPLFVGELPQTSKARPATATSPTNFGPLFIGETPSTRSLCYICIAATTLQSPPRRGRLRKAAFSRQPSAISERRRPRATRVLQIAQWPNGSMSQSGWCPLFVGEACSRIREHFQLGQHEQVSVPSSSGNGFRLTRFLDIHHR
jgi:hypothetical protein